MRSSSDWRPTRSHTAQRRPHPAGPRRRAPHTTPTRDYRLKQRHGNQPRKQEITHALRYFLHRPLDPGPTPATARPVGFHGHGAMVAMLALTSTGCASNTTPSTTTSAPTSAAASSSPANDPAGKEQVCAARDQLETSVTALTSVSLLAEGTTAIQAAVDQVQSDLAAVKKAGKQDYEAEVDAMQSAVDQLQTAAGTWATATPQQTCRQWERPSPRPVPPPTICSPNSRPPAAADPEEHIPCLNPATCHPFVDRRWHPIRHNMTVDCRPRTQWPTPHSRSRTLRLGAPEKRRGHAERESRRGVRRPPDHHDPGREPDHDDQDPRQPVTGPVGN